ncbi:MAG TPA: TetR/AcrR family transcriptional regulator [Candidatus Ruania gallistercoris]|uniref:TetR/AcrR family transcriptional regulator n=1 Tax=Candidatus Ruania gallistercoris TaxID=2838746 RepID=A0A9D2EFA5_9MICO|nr:TetR/AcrR family transcriptional regulator [Candidatus Ruania gallistercoris]
MTSADADERHAAIIRAVWQVIAERGMAGVSMRTVASAAGVSVGRIQYRFHTKDELLRSSLTAMLSGAAEGYTEASAGADDRSALWQLIAHPLPRTKAARTGVALFHQYVAGGVTHPALADLLAEAKDGAEREAARLIARIAPHVQHPRTVARSLIAAADGLSMRVLTGGLSARAAERTLRATLDRALRPEQ